MNSTGHRMFRFFGSMVFLAGVQLTIAPAVDARVTRVQIVSMQSPTFVGLSFGSVGQFEKIFAIAYGESGFFSKVSTFGGVVWSP